MTFSIGLVVGLIAGWLVEWFIDWRFWRRGDGGLQDKLSAAEAEINKLRRQRVIDQKKLERLASTEAEVSALQAKLTKMAEQAGQVVVKEKDRLEKINGVGPAFARRFHQAGVYTFADLANLTPERVREIISPETWQKIEPEAWITEAKKFAQSSDGSKVGSV